MDLHPLLSSGILILDGAYGTRFQALGLAEEDYRRGLRELKDHPVALKGNHDLLNLTRPDAVEKIHTAYVEAGAQILKTNTFNSTTISQADYQLSPLASRLALEGTRIARRVADRFSTPERPILVAGDVGPTNKTLSLSPDVARPAYRATSFRSLEQAYYEQIAALVEGGADLILIETIFDTLNAKAAACAYARLRAENRKSRIEKGRGKTSNDASVADVPQFSIFDSRFSGGGLPPLWFSATITDRSGRTLSGQTLEAFVASVAHAQPALLGLNCALGAREMLPYLRELSRLAPCAVSAHPNAGLPNALGGYDDSPTLMASTLAQAASEGLVNVVGGCCGSTPEHIAAIAAAVKGISPRKIPLTENRDSKIENGLGKALSVQGQKPIAQTSSTLPVDVHSRFSILDSRSILSLSGLEPLTSREGVFWFIGERTNLSGSPRFAKLIREGNLAAALQIAADQVRNGANLIDINFDDALLDGPALMREFCNLIASEPEIARVPLMLDSSHLPTIEAGLQSTQGKCIVNSISLKDGEAKFLASAALLRRYGAAAIVMAFDERGQATDVPRRVEICRRAYALLLQNGWSPADIIFDPNILTIGTGMAEHADYAKDFLTSLPLIKSACPGARVSGGVSNLSFAFRGQNAIREALHAVFLYHALRAGLDMAIVNAGMIAAYEDVEPQLRQLCEALIFNRPPGEENRESKMANGSDKSPAAVDSQFSILDSRSSPTEALLAYAASHSSAAGIAKKTDTLSWRTLPIAERLSHALLHGLSDFVQADALEALREFGTPLKVIEGPLMDGMRRVGDLFGEGKMFLPQVVKTARVMKEFVAVLEPYMSASAKSKRAGKILLATVKGDVHDIGKNIVGVVLGCNNYEVIDLGVMVPMERILAAIREHKPDLIGFSGLITPSLHEMVSNAQELRKEGVTTPLLIGGATTSRLHTALKIAPEYAASVHVPDASRVVEVCQKLLSPAEREAYLRSVADSYAELREAHARRAPEALTPLAAARSKPPALSLSPRVPSRFGLHRFDTVTLTTLVNFIDWSPFFWAWNLKGLYPKILEQPEAKKLFADAQKLLNSLIASRRIQPRGVIGFWPAWRDGDDICVLPDDDAKDAPIFTSDVDSRFSIFDSRTPRFHFLRQQRPSGSEGAFASLADFVAPKSSTPDSLGGFVVSATESIDAIAKEYSGSGDDYSALIVKALGDRIAEAFAEYAHVQARRLWGQASPADSVLADLLAEKYHGIRPASGYPSCPDHSEKELLWQLLDAEACTGARLTETCAMWPASTVSGLYFHHPQSRYFNIGKIGADQLSDYAARKGWSEAQSRKWLAALL